MDFKEMEYILAILREGNLSKAAKAMCTTQPSISRTVMKLEKQLGIRLFDKEKSPWELTYSGELFVQKSKVILSLEKSFMQEVQKTTNSVQKQLVVGIMPFEERYFLPRVLPIFKSKYPDFTLDIISKSPTEAESLILSNKIDFAILAEKVKNPEIKYTTIKTYNFIFALPMNRYLAQKYKNRVMKDEYPCINLAELKNESFILAKEDFFVREIFINTCLKSGFTPNIALEVNNFDTALALASAGYGGAFILDELLEYLVLPRKTIYFKIKEYNISPTISFAYKRGRILNEVEQYFLDILLENKSFVKFL